MSITSHLQDFLEQPAGHLIFLQGCNFVFFIFRNAKMLFKFGYKSCSCVVIPALANTRQTIIFTAMTLSLTRISTFYLMIAPSEHGTISNKMFYLSTLNAISLHFRPNLSYWALGVKFYAIFFIYFNNSYWTLKSGSFRIMFAI